MVNTPNWLGASAGYPGNAGQINQFLQTHTGSWLYQGVQRSAQTTGTGNYQSTQSQYLSQRFTTSAGQSSIGTVLLQISTVGGSPITPTITPLTVGIYDTLPNATTPTGTALVTAELSEQYVYSSPFWVTVALPIIGLAPLTTYQIVVNLAGTSSAYYAWQQSNQTSGASTSPDGVTWTPSTYGLMYQVYDQSVVGPGLPQVLYEDGGNRTTLFSYTNGRLTSITESILLESGVVNTTTRSLTYSGSYLIQVS